ncbi:non-homologous end-joining DNA ligase [Pelotomaculum propionicicum]|uniref:DNA ligase (ATP) n=1 Tax=Pelotomaculum propionicicum TaxID=258475 RepID=A0A4Y7RNA6_9FIRM|nr:non-homologous end-joining DNA ligase [Pelotomaculum propionicicum]NLI11940.1 ATP-dependent DNA ligase [Peptococcaceae bacterium]TEB10152.1 Multifunctional non-homologous end joining DNA repair protein LigD [Pelotomaculum propionicicum]
MNGDKLPLLRPMLAVSAAPFDSAGHIFEVKWDGYRCLAYLEGGATVLWSRNGINLTSRFPELSWLHTRVKQTPAVLDGEIVVFENGKPSFAGLQSRGRMNDLKRIGRSSSECPAVFISFDLLYAGGKSLLELAIEKRKEVLADIVEPGDEICVSQFINGSGREFFKACVAQGLEGAVAKKLGSVYLPGRRSAYWQKFRHTREVELVVCGYQPQSSGRRLGSLVLGGYREGELVYQGKVGSGIGERESEALLEGLRKLENSKETLTIPREERRRTKFVRPLLVCSIEYLTATGEGYLRHPVYKGIRWDKNPAECHAVEE